jgi:hypothetical protein
LQALDDRALTPIALRQEAARVFPRQAQPLPPPRVPLRAPSTTSLSSWASAGRAVSSLPRPESSGADSSRKHWVPQEGDVVETLDGHQALDGGGVAPVWWLGTVVSAHPLGKYLVEFRDTEGGGTRWYSRSALCLPNDEECMDVAELRAGWSRTEGGGYLMPERDEDEFEQDEGEEDEEDDEDDEDEDDDRNLEPGDSGEQAAAGDMS